MGLAAKFSVFFSRSTLGPVGVFGSDFFCEILAKYFGASGWASRYRGTLEALPVFSTSASYLAPERFGCLMIVHSEKNNFH